MTRRPAALDRLRDQRGLTLTELTVVFVLATILMSGLVAFYLNSQGTWLEGSSQSVSQREVTLVLASISTRARAAKSVTVSGSPHAFIQIDPAGLTTSAPVESTYFYWWSAADSLIHEGYRIPVVVDRGPMLQSKVELFQASSTLSLLNIQNLQVHTAEGERISMGTQAAILNAGAN